jgi:hypothetical protein
METNAELETQALVAEIVGECFPDEAPLVEHYSSSGTSPSVAKGPLGIGVAEVIPLALPFIWSLVAEVVAALRGALATGLAKQIADWVLSQRASRPPATELTSAEHTRNADAIARELKKNSLAHGREQIVAAVVLRVLVQRAR